MTLKCLEWEEWIRQKSSGKFDKKGTDHLCYCLSGLCFQGYEVHAFHYILKPYKKEKIKEVLESAVKELSAQQEQFYMVQQKSGTLRLSIREITYFKSDRRNV